MNSHFPKCFRTLVSLPLVSAAILFCQSPPLAAGDLAETGTIVPDTLPVKQPRPWKLDDVGDGLDRILTKPFLRMFDLARYVRLVLRRPIEAADVDQFDNVPNSSWFTPRIGARPLSLHELASGPDSLSGPDTSGDLTIVKHKIGGAVPGFIVKDRHNVQYLLKTESPGYPELNSGADAVSNRIFYACGYNVSKNVPALIDPKRFKIRPGTVYIDTRKQEWPFTQEVLSNLLRNLDHRPDGRIRFIASRWVPGKLLGGWLYTGTRNDDPNDRIPHERRRELRGLRVIAAWINYYDLNVTNMLDSYDTNSRYVKHYLIDYHNSLGSNSLGPVSRSEGLEPYFDGYHFLRNIFTLGFYRTPWEVKNPVPPPAAGFWYSNGFTPDGYSPFQPSEAFEDMTDRDAYWGAKIVTSFSDEQIDAVVHAGNYSDIAAETYVARQLKERRDIVGRFYFNKVSPLEGFMLTGPTGSGDYTLRFADLAVKHGFAKAQDRRYRISVNGAPGHRESAVPEATITDKDLQLSGNPTVTIRANVLRVGNGGWCRAVRLDFMSDPDGSIRLKGITR